MKTKEERRVRMPSEFQGPFSSQGYELSQSAQLEGAAGSLTSQQRKIDPMGMMGKIFVSLGAFLVVVGALVALLLGFFIPRGFGFFFAITAGGWGTGLIFVLVGLVQLRFFRNVKSAAVIENYLMALANQNYAAAFQYLDPAIMTGQNEPDAESWFARRAQAYDDEQGRISDYTLRAFSLNGWGARYTIKLRRGAQPYIVRFFLLKRGDTWKIMEFDRF